MVFKYLLLVSKPCVELSFVHNQTNNNIITWYSFGTIKKIWDNFIKWQYYFLWKAYKWKEYDFFKNSFDGLYNYHLLNLLYNITYYAYNVNYVYLLVGCFPCLCFWLLVLRFISSFILISRLYKCNWNWIKRLLNVFKLFFENRQTNRKNTI